MKTNFFETKEQYLNFRSAWKLAVNDIRIKPILEPCDEYLVDRTSYKWTLSKGTGRRLVKGWICAEHHVLFNIIRGKDASVGFSPIKGANKITSNLNDPYNALNCAVHTINSVCKQARLIVGKDVDSPWTLKQSKEYLVKLQIDRIATVSKFLAPFAGTVTVDHLANLEEVDYHKKGE